MLSPRWIKLLRDARLTPGRFAMMVLAIAAGVCGLATMLSSYSILARETTRNYRATNPPSATLTIAGIDAGLMAQVRRFPGIAQAEAGATAGAIVHTGSGAALPLTLFVVGDFNALQINKVQRAAGAWPPPDGAILLERDALGLAGTGIGGTLQVQAPSGLRTEVAVAGTVHDPALPPASRGQTVYAYASSATVAALGLDGTLRNLKLTVSDHPYQAAAIEATVARLGAWLRAQGHPVERIRIPPPGEHPHQRIMNSILLMLLVFSAIALVLSAILSATILGGMLSQQRRQIGVMKTLGATSAQLAGLYLALVLCLAVAGTALGAWAGLGAGRAFAGVVLGEILNFTMEDKSLPAIDYVLLLGAGIVLPLLLALVPVLQAARATVQAALSDVASVRQYYRAPGRLHLPFLSRSLSLALRNSLRRRARLLLTLVLLAMAGAMTMSSMNVRTAAGRHLQEAATDRRYDLETVLARPAGIAQVRRIAASVPGVALIEPWLRAPATRARSDGLEIERTYPDGDHGTLAIAAVPDASAMLALQMLSGRWLAPGETGTVVLNNTAALNFFPDAKVGDMLALSSRANPVRLRLAGIARQYMSPALAFVTPATYAALHGPSERAQVYRVVMREHDGAAIDLVSGELEAALAAAGIGTRLNITETMMRKDVDGHFDLMIAALLFISVLMALIGAVGLGSAMGSNVAERSREFGIMRSIGASGAVVLRNVLAEGVFVGLMSLPLAFALALPVSKAIGAYLGNMLFGLPFPFALSGSAALGWLAIVVAGSMLASGLPAWRASRFTIHHSLTQL
ncbi:MAG: ABC transporter permease [Pseudomonadota bacterium]